MSMLVLWVTIVSWCKHQRHTSSQPLAHWGTADTASLAHGHGTTAVMYHGNQRTRAECLLRRRSMIWYDVIQLVACARPTRGVRFSTPIGACMRHAEQLQSRGVVAGALERVRDRLEPIENGRDTRAAYLPTIARRFAVPSALLQSAHHKHCRRKHVRAVCVQQHIGQVEVGKHTHTHTHIHTYTQAHTHTQTHAHAHAYTHTMGRWFSGHDTSAHLSEITRSPGATNEPKAANRYLGSTRRPDCQCGNPWVGVGTVA